MDLALEFGSAARLCTTLSELSDLLEAAALELGFKHYAVVHSARLRRDAPEFASLDNYPPGWAEEFVGKGLFVDDPVLAASQRTAKAFAWDKVGDLLPLQPRHREVLERSARYGLGSGFTIPANVPGETCGSCSFAAKPGRRISEGRLRLTELIGIDASDAARRILRPQAGQEPPHLSRREFQCLSAVANGASDKAVARMLKISPETVRRYIKTARAAYRAGTRTQAVVRALRDGQISF